MNQHKLRRGILLINIIMMFNKLFLESHKNLSFCFY